MKLLQSSRHLFICIFTSIALLMASAAIAQPENPVHVSPKKPWGDFEVVKEDVGYPWWGDVLAWLPNRVMDLVDVFRVDIGVGPSTGGVIRISKYAQAGYRSFSPTSIRVGDFGRERLPFMAETSGEIGISPSFKQSKDRDVCTGEIGVGVDPFLFGAYAGICVEELVDFVAGIFFFDIMDDDLK